MDAINSIPKDIVSAYMDVPYISGSTVLKDTGVGICRICKRGFASGEFSKGDSLFHKRHYFYLRNEENLHIRTHMHKKRTKNMFKRDIPKKLVFEIYYEM
jgi:hypothetical protein